ncbi:MAG: hypothetical protein HY924_08255 [Elusimicrobia bacterium]|nr:hypothetical protein [Elusimicrobiota bacterium]
MNGLRGRGPALAACVLLSAGCGVPMKRAYLLTDRQAGELSAKLGTVGLPTASFLPKSEVLTPAKGALDGAGRGAASAAGALFGAASESKSGEVAAIGILLTPAGALVGGVAGAILAEKPEVVEAWEAEVGEGLRALGAQAGLRDAVLKWGLRKTSIKLMPLDGQGPASLEGQPDYSGLKDRGVDTVLEVSVLGVGLSGAKTLNPDLALLVTARSRVVSVSDGKELFSRDYSCSGAERKFKEWAARSGAKLRPAFQGCVFRLARSMVLEAFQLDTLLAPEPEITDKTHQ